MLPEAWDAVRLFVRSATQWRYGPMGDALGLDYAGLEAAARMMQVSMDEQILDQVQTLEQTVQTERRRQRQMRDLEHRAKRAADEAAGRGGRR